ncbi:hypothetical protein [Nocardioides sp. InS609-2]|uniref:hypothetical protein n=1 Tax=Nocardioides sp. InS609-2 TaxID=2760705 RepID=UPI0020C0BABF|nr:hypothetical protein [Nocardioides sp. InS609-2]
MISLASIGTVSTIFAGAATTWVGIRKITQKSERLRNRIEADVALLGQLPDGSAGRKDLQAHIDLSIRELVRVQQRQLGASWDPYGLIWAAIFAAIAAASGLVALRSDYLLPAKIALWGFCGLTAVFTAVAVSVAHKQDDDKPESV